MRETDPETPCVLLEWDSEFWGFPVAQIVGGTLSEPGYRAVTVWSSEHGIRCLFLLADTYDAATARIAANHDFRLVDERITLGYFAPSRPAPSPQELPTGVLIRPSRPEDLAALQAIAWSSHVDTRFFVDPQFPRERAHELYERWIAASCAGFADLVLVASLRGEIAGYCSCHLPANNFDPGRIGLLAVAPSARGHGVARSLVEHAKAWLMQQEAAHVTVVTQDRNLAALTLYQRCGFTIQTRQHWYHRWFTDQSDEGS